MGIETLQMVSNFFLFLAIGYIFYFFIKFSKEKRLNKGLKVSSSIFIFISFGRILYFAGLSFFAFLKNI